MRRSTWFLAGGFMALAMAAGVIGVHHDQTKIQAATKVSGLQSTQLPPALSPASGLAPITGLTMESSGSAPLWMGKDGSGPFTPTQLGLQAGLAQIWVSSAAVAQYGSLGHGLALPLPASFVAAHPGQPLEVYVIELAFNNTTAPHTLLGNDNYNFHLSVYQNLVTPLPQTVDGGWAYSMGVPDHNGETEYLYQWAHGAYWNQVAVLGNISATQALAVAQQVTS